MFTYRIPSQIITISRKLELYKSMGDVLAQRIRYIKIKRENTEGGYAL
jgi:hypothetical protein